MTAWGGTGSAWFAPPFEVLAAFALPCGAPPDVRFFGDIPGKAGGRGPPKMFFCDEPSNLNADFVQPSFCTN